ncbi:MAG TPA: DUF418 domain-containing protein, partial [Chitinophagaceae bacterium]
VKLTPKQTAQLSAYQALKEKSTPEAKMKNTQSKLRQIGRGSYEDIYKKRTDDYINSLVTFLFFEFWDVLIFMFLGMAFFKLGILTGKAHTYVYLSMFIIGMTAGIFLTYLQLQPNIRYGFNSFEIAKNSVIQFNQLGRVLRSLGIFGLIMLLYKSGVFKWLFELLRPVGQMAFTNYLMQSLMCGLFFYSIGFGMYGKLERYEMYYVVLAVWVVQIIYSHIWLRYFRFGPFEWAWRSLTYWKRQPMKR